MTPKKRAYPRHHHEASIRYAKIKTKDYLDSKMYNFSKEGLYFEPEFPLETKTDVGIIMPGYSPGTYGPESYKFYVARIRWCREVMNNGSRPRFGIGAQILSKSHEIREPADRKILYTCDLCGRLVSFEHLHQSEKSVNLCPDCFKHLKSISQGDLRDVIEGFLGGNVI